MTPKEVLLKHGKIAAITRGRISSENHAFLRSLVEAGEKIDGYEPVVKTKTNGETVVKNTMSVSNEKVIADFTLVRPLNTKAHAFHNGKKVAVGMAAVCQNCRVSLVQCTCGAPEVVNHSGSGPMRVYIEDSD